MSRSTFKSWPDTPLLYSRTSPGRMERSARPRGSQSSPVRGRPRDRSWSRPTGDRGAGLLTVPLCASFTPKEAGTTGEGCCHPAVPSFLL